MAGYGGTDNTAGGELLGGGKLSAREGADVVALPSDAASVPVGQWPPASWGPKLYQFDASGNRVAVPWPGE
jgi:hypothetical protein